MREGERKRERMKKIKGERGRERKREREKKRTRETEKSISSTDPLPKLQNSQEDWPRAKPGEIQCERPMRVAVTLLLKLLPADF